MLNDSRSVPALTSSISIKIELHFIYQLIFRYFFVYGELIFGEFNTDSL